eukprot:XP_019920738.1 PREDICTED: uncharacterized protein LOC105323041 isoform X2 [Crassostrea gigas]
MLGVFSGRFAVFMSFFFIGDIISLNVNLYFEKNDKFKDLLPITGDDNYIYTKNDLSLLECAGSCKFCAGFLYNSGSKTCHLLKSLLNETSFNRDHVDIGWELYESLNVCGSGWHLYNTHCYTYLDLKITWADAKKLAAIGFVVMRGSGPVTKLRRVISSGQTKKMWYSPTGWQNGGNPTTTSTRTVLLYVSMVNGMIIVVLTF